MTEPARMGGQSHQLVPCFLRNPIAVSGEEAMTHCAYPGSIDMKGPYFFASFAKFWCTKALSKCGGPMSGSPVRPGGKFGPALPNTILSRAMTTTVVTSTVRSHHSIVITKPQSSQFQIHHLMCSLKVDH